MKSKIQLYFLVNLICLTFLSCEKGDQFDCIKSTGKIIQQVRSVPAFTSIHLEDNINLVLTNDNTGSIIVEAGENLQKKIITTSEGGHLYVRNENKCNWVRSYKKLIKVYIGINQLYDVFHNGYGDITTEGILNKNSLIVHHYSNGNIHLNLNSENLWLDMDQLASVTIEGKTESITAFTYDLAKLNTENLQCHNFYLISKSDGEARIRADNELGVSIEGKGNVYYSGSPASILLSGSGGGKLIKAD